MKSFYEEMGGTYRREGDYYIPNLIIPESPVLGIRGQRRRRFLMEHRTMLHCLVGFRNQLISEGRYTDAVDELILKLDKCKKHRRWFW